MEKTINEKSKKINAEQLRELFDFTRKHYVDYHDLQCELADHLAHAIEQRWEEEPLLSFEEALQAEFKKFGIFGFSDIVAERHNALFKRYYRLVWREFRSVLTFPVLLIAVLATWGMYHSLMAYHHSYALFMLAFLVTSSWKLHRLKKQYRKKLKDTGHKWLFEEIIFSCGGFGVMMTVPMQFSHFVLDGEISPLLATVMSIVLSLMFIYDYVVLFRMPSKAKTYLQKVYPEYGLENLA
ncbi:hypothetical protein OGH69_09510 [Flavobacterium sp. MFBS3-15]|uniref:hypothetical protein n=1 Tax=Flavobacterium sp. MFBS3-15 TaxID=2989816 RepID=UPI002235750D|nr:hypothetical protein [Flavobacterium sp. MFBS3-15]MCW4469201.1 hypothetical protein [Flavobacterium sp. MFBS3-15]